MTDSVERGAAVFPDTATISVKGQPVAVSIEGKDSVSINDFKGIAEGARKDDGTFEIHIRESPPRGRDNEPNVFSVLEHALRIGWGREVEIKEGSKEDDKNGIDGWIIDEGKRFTVQVVTVPSDRQLGRDVALGNAWLEFDANQGAKWIREAISLKERGTACGDRRQILLALDARHTAILGHPEIVGALAQFDPCLGEIGFLQIWLVGPGLRSTRQLA